MGVGIGNMVEPQGGTEVRGGGGQEGQGNMGIGRWGHLVSSPDRISVLAPVCPHIHVCDHAPMCVPMPLCVSLCMSHGCLCPFIPPCPRAHPHVPVHVPMHVPMSPVHVPMPVTVSPALHRPGAGLGTAGGSGGEGDAAAGPLGLRGAVADGAGPCCCHSALPGRE